jgi:GWxTD domain-containing protein
MSLLQPALISAMADHLWQSTLFAFGAIGLTCLLRTNSARARYRVLLAASLKFLFPFWLLVQFGGHITRKPAPVFTRPALVLTVRKVGQPFTPISRPPIRAPSTTPQNSRLLTTIAMLWLAGASGVLTVWFIRWRTQAEKLRSASIGIHCGIESKLAPRLRVRSSLNAVAPGVFGIFRPLLVLPADIGDRLEEEELESILRHEVAHVRHWDNLGAALHMLVQTIFWFHPLVWWMGTQLLLERERACDEDVLQSGCDRAVYAEAILKVCNLYISSPRTCVAGVASNSNLKKRIEEIMNYKEMRKIALAQRLTVVAMGIVAVGLPIWMGFAGAPEIRASTAHPGLAPVPVVQTPISNVQAPAAQRTVTARLTPPPPEPKQQAPATRLPQAEQRGFVQMWLEDVSYIITPEEEAAFKNLKTDEEVDEFVKQFWLRRDPTPGASTNAFRDEYYRRIGWANDHFTARVPGWKTDRGRIYIVYGPPDQITAKTAFSAAAFGKAVDAGGNNGPVARTPVETWSYNYIADKGANITFNFVQDDDGNFHLAQLPLEGTNVIDLFNELRGLFIKK